MQSTRFGQDFHLRSRSFRNAVDAIGEIPLAADEQVPEHLHENHARRSFHCSANRTVKTWAEDAFEHFFPSDSLEIGLSVFAVERTAESAAAMDESAMMAQQVESKTKRSDARAERNSAIEKQVVKASAAVAAAAGGVLNADAELAFAHQR